MEIGINFNPFPIIKTERLLLRKLDVSDWNVISYLRSDVIVNKFVRRPKAENKTEAIKFIDKINEGIGNNEFIYWSICLKNRPVMIGSICLWNFSPDKKTAEVGYDLNPDFQKKGIMQEGLRSILDFGFNELNLDFIEAFTHRENESSKKLLEKNGFLLVEKRKDEDNPDNIIFAIGKSTAKIDLL